MGSGDAPSAIYFILITGSLTALNKDSPVETQERLAAGEECRLRPVNSGSGILKTCLREALSQPAAQRALAELLPIQMGGIPSGPQTKIYMARLLYDEGYFASLQDAINAFNAIHRQAVLDAETSCGPKPRYWSEGCTVPKHRACTCTMTRTGTSTWTAC